jgi:hypothetical protein
LIRWWTKRNDAVVQPRPIAAALVAAVLTVAPSVAVAQNRTEDILARAGAYASDFINRFTNVVAEERFVQDARPVVAAGGRKGSVVQAVLHRELLSDYLLVKNPGRDDRRAFRDVREVDGRPVADRQERLTQIFVEPSGTVLEQARRIELDGVRYSLGDGYRTINSPFLVLGFLQPGYQRRFRFTVREQDKEAGPDIWIVEFREQTRPTILRLVPDGDIVATGRFWVERQTGRVVRTELNVSDSDSITTEIRYNERLQMDVPFELREHYFFDGQYVTGTATYDGFRQFEVRTEERIEGKQ